MLHDVTIDIHNPGHGARREVVTVDAISGDDAASQAAVEAARLAAGRGWKIVGVSPSAPPVPDAPVAFMEGEEANMDDVGTPDELEPVRRRGRPPKARATAMLDALAGESGPA